MYKVLLRPLLFLFPPEFIHNLTFLTLKIAVRVPGIAYILRKQFTLTDGRLTRNFCGLRFANPVGLAAGFDKNAKLIDTWPSVGFGFAEIGTVTPVEQIGNPKPRLFRLPKDHAILNRMGFNNDGAATIAKRITRRKRNFIVGGNIGRNKSTPNKLAVEDYIKCVEALRDHVDYFAVNVSSPNTPNLRQLQEKEPLRQLLREVKARASKGPTPRPVLLKIAPDLTQEQILDVIEVVKDTHIDGVIATNTTLSRDHLETPAERVSPIGEGGLSGRPLTSRSNDMIKFLREQLGKDYFIIGVGGIMTPEDAVERLRSGADLIQVYTGFVYEGPAFMKRICRAILQSES